MLTDADVLKIAALARLNLSPEEVKQYGVELSQILDYVQQLNTYNVDSVEPLSHVHGSSNVFRADELTPSLKFEGTVSANAPDKAGRFFRVPLVVE